MNLNQRIHLAAGFRGMAFPFLCLPYEELALLSVWKPQDGLTMGTGGLGVVSWNGLRPAGMQLNGTNAQKEWQAPAARPLGGSLALGWVFFKHLRLRLEESWNINQPTSWTPKKTTKTMCFKACSTTKPVFFSAKLSHKEDFLPFQVDDLERPCSSSPVVLTLSTWFARQPLDPPPLASFP